MDNEEKNKTTNSYASDLAEKIVRAARLSSNLINQKTENLTEHIQEILVKRIIILVFLAVFTFVASFLSLYLGIQYILLNSELSIKALTASLISSLVILAMSLILLGIAYVRIHAQK